MIFVPLIYLLKVWVNLPSAELGKGPFTIYVYSFFYFLSTYLPLVYNHLHLTNHLPTVNVYILNFDPPQTICTSFCSTKEGEG